MTGASMNTTDNYPDTNLTGIRQDKNSQYSVNATL